MVWVVTCEDISSTAFEQVLSLPGLLWSGIYLLYVSQNIVDSRLCTFLQYLSIYPNDARIQDGFISTCQNLEASIWITNLRGMVTKSLFLLCNIILLLQQISLTCRHIYIIEKRQ